MKFRKKPVVVEAVRFPYDGIITQEFINFLKLNPQQAMVGEGYNFWEINTLEGTMVAEKGDWVIKGIKGEFYPCKPDIFEATYEPVE